MFPDNLRTSMDVVVHLAGGEAQDLIALTLEPRLALEITQGNASEHLVDSAVDLNHELRVVDRKICEVPAYRRLATEVRPQLPQLLPQLLLGEGHAPT